ncbi:proton-conducting transporter membrane subunit [Actinomadura luteofluorescens]|uniref:proton-conducting transporter transmembrane domain-containing protein n=1 Tax=Actinomadura luteofluorescens TaxID=46163 RepID=UPI00362C00CF
MPMHLWLPDAYPAALTKVTAVFAALLTKAAVYALIRVETLVFPREHGSWVMLVLAAGTMVVGTLGALANDDIHRVFSFTLVGHIGYMLFGLALFSVAGLTGAILYLVHHIVVQATLFLVSDLIQARTGETSLHRLGGLARLSALIAVLFFIPAMSVSGVPPTSGFVAKLALFQAGLGSGRPLAYAVTGVAVLASLLTLMAMARIWALGFWRPRPAEAGEPPPPSPTRGAGCG